MIIYLFFTADDLHISLKINKKDIIKYDKKSKDNKDEDKNK